ncbi:hypothetical protein L6452_18939 [Arctium lappa]|uniref:Uncharacterized protein n=1 Tax=Arctium lappa TaxID=4217 RepID=A0ACB9BBN7_ARCLA|nr:hypothetical protein L6452_18939 [Arctium lappa]
MLGSVNVIGSGSMLREGDDPMLAEVIGIPPGDVLNSRKEPNEVLHGNGVSSMETMHANPKNFTRVLGEVLSEGVPVVNATPAERLEYGNVKILSKNFAEAVGGSTPTALKFFPLEDKKKNVVSILIYLAK